MPTTQELQKIATQVRRDIIRMTNHAKSGHPGGSLGNADLMTKLFFDVLKCEPENFTHEGAGEDMFFLSIGHITPVYYSVMARAGYFPVAELNGFRKIDNMLQGHPSVAKKIPGVRVASGSLGQGLSVALGAAEAKRLNQDPQLIYVLLGDGEMGEGQNWEAILYAASKKVDNLIAIVDRNGVQIDGRTEDVLALGDLKTKFQDFGWHALEMEGNDFDSLSKGLQEAKDACGKGKPVAIVMNTKMGYGVDFMTDDNKWHGVAPNDEQAAKALAQLEETLGDF